MRIQHQQAGLVVLVDHQPAVLRAEDGLHFGQRDLVNLAGRDRLGDPRRDAVDQRQPLRLGVQLDGAPLDLLEQPGVFERHRRQVRQALDHLQVRAEAGRVLRLATQAQRPDHLPAGDHRHDQRGALAARIPRPQIGPRLADSGLALELVDARLDITIGSAERGAVHVQRLVHCDRHRIVRREIGAQHVEASCLIVEQRDTHAREGRHLLQTAPDGLDHRFGRGRARHDFHHFVQALFLLGGAHRLLVEPGRLDGCRRLRGEQLERLERCLGRHAPVSRVLHADDADDALLVVADQGQVDHVARVPGIFRHPLDILTLQGVLLHPGTVVAQVVARAEFQLVEGQIVDPRAPYFARHHASRQVVRRFRRVPGVDHRRRLEMLVAQGDQHPAPARLADALGHDLQARGHVLRLLDLAGDQVQLREAVALAAGGLGFLLDAGDQPVVLDAEGGLIGENLQRLDRVQVRAAA